MHNPDPQPHLPPFFTTLIITNPLAAVTRIHSGCDHHHTRVAGSATAAPQPLQCESLPAAPSSPSMPPPSSFLPLPASASSSGQPTAPTNPSKSKACNQAQFLLVRPSCILPLLNLLPTLPQSQPTGLTYSARPSPLTAPAISNPACSFPSQLQLHRPAAAEHLVIMWAGSILLLWCTWPSHSGVKDPQVFIRFF